MKRGSVLTVVAMICSLAAAYVSYTLLLKHVTGKSEAAWFDLGCSDDAGPGAANCAAVLASPYSYLPKRTGDRKGGIPVAFLGLVYYTVLGIWFLGVGIPSREKRAWHFFPLFVVGFGLAGSAYFIFIMFTKLDQWCPWCLVTHALNLVIAVCVVLMWPRSVAVRAANNVNGVAKTKHSADAPCHPSGRIVLTTVVAIVFAMFAHVELMRFEILGRTAMNLDTRLEQYKQYIQRIKTNGDMFVAMWKTQPALSIALRSDDPVRYGNAGDAEPLEVVVFSDFECPSCARFALFFEQNVVALFGGHIRTTFKHYPIDQSCNKLVSRTLHPHACEAARMAEAVRMLGGNDAFWKAHDFLYHNRNALAAGRIGVQEVANAVGIDAASLSSQMKSETIAARIAGDIALAGSLGVRGTPAVYVNGATVDPLAKVEVAFWDKMADDYFRSVGLKRPASTRPQNHAATQGIQGRRVAP